MPKLNEPIVNKIYLIYDLSGKSAGYVGWTTKTLEMRYYFHVYTSDKRKSKNHVCCWLRKINYNVGMLLLETVPEGQSWKEAEQKWIKHYQEVLGWDLKNQTIGGDGVLGLKWSEKSRKNQAKSKKIYYQTHDGPSKGRVKTKEEIKKQSNTMLEWHKTHDHPLLGKQGARRGTHNSKSMKKLQSESGKIGWVKRKSLNIYNMHQVSVPENTVFNPKQAKLYKLVFPIEQKIALA